MLGLALILLRVLQIQKRILERQRRELFFEGGDFDDPDVEVISEDIKTLELIEHDLKAAT